MPKLKLAIIGATGSALKRNIPALQNSEKVVVSAVQARNQDKLKQIQERYGITRIFTNEKELLESADYDFIFVATPPFLHESNIKNAVRTGKPIVCEKPLAQNIEDAQKIAVLLKDYKSPFMVAHQLRHQQAIADIKDSINKGIIGDPTSCWSQWAFKLNPTASNASWKLNPKLGGGGPFVDAGIHVIDLMIFLFGSPKSVIGHQFKMEFANNDDNATALLCYQKLTVAINASQNTPAFGNHLLIYGSKGKIEAFGAMGEKSIQKIIIKSEQGEEVRNYDETKLYSGEIEDFADFIAGRAESHRGTSLAEAICGMHIIEAIRKSSLEGKQITI